MKKSEAPGEYKIPKTTLEKWAKGWDKIKRDSYRELVDSYTPEQRELQRRMNKAAVQNRLCWLRWRWPVGATGKHKSLIRWPEPPPGAAPTDSSEQT